MPPRSGWATKPVVPDDRSMPHKPGDIIEGTDPRECPFCSGKLYFWPLTGGLMHVEPICEPFDRLDVEDFMAAAVAAVQDKQ